jgi:hypothetical protein
MAPIASRPFVLGGGYGAIAQLGERIVRNDEVGGSIPPGSTSLRSLRELRLGKPRAVHPGEASKGCPAEARRTNTGLASAAHSAACAIGTAGISASQSSMNLANHARSATSYIARPSK